MRKRLVPRIAIVYLTKTSKGTLFYSHGNQRPPSEINSLAPLNHTSVAAQSKRQSIGLWEINGLMTRIDIAKTRTICKGRLSSIFALTEEWLQMSLSTSFLNGDVAQKVERPFRMREERGSMPRISKFSEKTGIRKTNTTGSCFLRIKEKTLISTSNIRWEASETVVLAEKAIGAPKRHGSVYTGVEANVPTLLVC